MSTLIIFHGNCPDGYGSYWSAFKKFGKNAKYWAAFHGEDPPDVMNQDVFILDYCYPRKVMDELATKARSIVVVDHHVSNMESMTGFTAGRTEFDMNHSGAVLSWKEFHPNKPVPDLLRYIEDRDLWKWQLKNSNLFLSGLDSFPRSIALYDEAAFNPQKFIAIGEPIVRYRGILVENSMKNASVLEYEGQTFIAVNEGIKEIVSELGNKLVEKHNLPAFIWHYDHEGQETIVSLRSNDSLDVNVAEIAQKLGGGGHRNASGFQVKGLITL